MKKAKLNPWKIKVSSKITKSFLGDSDGDGVINMFDCQPHNKKKQGPEHEHEPVTEQQLQNEQFYRMKFIRERSTGRFGNP